MRVRIRRHPEYFEYWYVETFVWYWPFSWIVRCTAHNREAAMNSAKLYKHPHVEEVL